MRDLIIRFPQQLEEAIEIGQKAKLPKTDREIRNIVVSGLGGSGIGANMVYDMVGDQLSVPFTVNKNYDIPSWVDEHTLFIVSSYSGNTEETLAALDKAIAKGALISAISSGGKLAELAEEHNFGIIKIPGGMPPRACMGYSLVQQLFTLNHFGFIDSEFIEDLEDTIELLEENRDTIDKNALGIAEEVVDKTIVLYAPDGYESLVVRWRQQINENSKLLCWHHIIPEMNHNEILGWEDEYPKIAPFFFETADVFNRTLKRFELTKEVVSKLVPKIYEINVNGGSKILQMLYMAYIGDWISLHLAELRKLDPTSIATINYLKGELAKLD